MVLVVFLLSVCAVSVSCDWVDGDDSVDRAYGDLPGMPIAMNSSAEPRDCATLCLSRTDCVAWAYCKPNCGGEKDPQCYLKAKVMPQSYNPCRVCSCCRGL